MISLQLIDYTVQVHDLKLIKDISLDLHAGSLHVLMGPNGSGKSSLALSLMGHPAYQVTGNALIDNQDITSLAVHKRAQTGLFLGFQHPYEIPGVQVASFLKIAYEALYGPIEPKILHEKVVAYLELLELDQSYYYRNLNEGFSGGQKKKFELLQLLLLKPRVAILDEIDSGLDVDALRVVGQALNIARKENPTMAVLLITHYQRILDHISVDHVHLLIDGKIHYSGDKSLAERIEQEGYDRINLCQKS